MPVSRKKNSAANISGTKFCGDEFDHVSALRLLFGRLGGQFFGQQLLGVLALSSRLKGSVQRPLRKAMRLISSDTLCMHRRPKPTGISSSTGQRIRPPAFWLISPDTQALVEHRPGQVIRISAQRDQEDHDADRVDDGVGALADSLPEMKSMRTWALRRKT
jgi:hypothetical protein